MLTDFPIKKNGSALNPLDAFPTKNDHLVKVIFSQKKKRSHPSSDYEFSVGSQRSQSQSQKWLSPHSIDATYGVQGDTTTDDIRRNYRRLNSSTLFHPLSPHNPESSLSELNPSQSHKKKFVLVEESSLQELNKFESLLKRERSLLGEQCVLALADNHFEARIPLPAIRMAVQNICEERMKRTRKEITLLNTEWLAFAKENHYLKPHLYLKESYLKNAPVSQRAIKLRLVREAAKEWAKRRDRDTMLFEDDMSYLTQRYYDALSRRRDYDRYFILAGRFGPFSEQEFNLDARPGKRYFHKATQGALKFQNLWLRFWSVLKLRRFRAAKMIQKHFRRHLVMRQLYPIIRLRVKFGKRSYYQFFWRLWREYTAIVKNIRLALYFRRYEWSLKCLSSWMKYVHDARDARAEKKKKLARKYGANAPIYFTFTRWKGYWKRIKSFQLKVRNLLSQPYYRMWIQYVAFQKHLKVLCKAATKLQTFFRTIKHKKIFQKVKKSQRMLRRCAEMVFAKNRCEAIRKVIVADEFVTWRPVEVERRNEVGNESERQRLNRRAAYVQQREKIAVAELKKHLKSADGNLQLNDMIYELQSGPRAKEISSLNKENKLEAAADELIKRCIAITRQVNNHDYDAKNPSFITCADPTCHCTLTTEDQYRNHVANLPYHQERNHHYSAFHLMLKHRRGVELVRAYLIKLHGMAGQVNTLDIWTGIQDWRKTAASRKDFLKKAIQLYDLFLTEDAPRKVPDIGNFAELSRVIQTLKHRESEGYYRVATARRGMLRQLLGLAAKSYEQWTDMYVLNPGTFDELEWKCFYSLFEALDKNESFLKSKEYLEFQEINRQEKEQQEDDLLADCRTARSEQILQWAKNYKVHENAMLAKADEAVMKFLHRETEKMTQEYGLEEILLRARQVSYEEQVAYEMKKISIDDALSWAEENVLEFVFDFYAKKLLEKMWSMPECQKGMLNYSGLLKTKLKKKLIVMTEMNTKKGNGQEWLPDFVKQAAEMDTSSLVMNPSGYSGSGSSGGGGNGSSGSGGGGNGSGNGSGSGGNGSGSGSGSQLDQNMAAVSIQKRMRGVFGRNRMRKIFVKTFVKQLDPESKAFYYVNLITNETSWTRPKFFVRLFPNSKW